MAKAPVNVFDQFDDPAPKAAPAVAAAPAGPNAFDQFDTPAAAPTAAPAAALTAAAGTSKPLLHQILDYAVNQNPVVGGAEMVGQAATGALSRIPAGIAGLTRAGVNMFERDTGQPEGGDPADIVANVEHALTYQPQSASGQAGDQGLAHVASAVTNNPVANKASELIDATGHGPLIKSAVPAIADAASSVFPLTRGLGAVGAAADELPAIVGRPNDADPLATARASGFKTSASNVALRNPTQQPGILNQLGEVASGGNSAITRANQADNTARTTELAGQQMGLGDNVTKITVPDLKTAKATPGAAYDLTGQALGDFKPTSNMSNLLKDAASDNSVDSTSAARTAANRMLAQIDPQTGLYAGGGPQLVKDISFLRESANTRPIANILEDEMDRQAQNSLSPTLTRNYRDARRQFAQIYTVQDALQGGQVDPQAIGDVHQANPNLLTGNLRLIGSAAQELPADMQLPTQSKDGALDAILDKTKGMLGSIVRPLMRSDLVQNQFGPQANAGGESYFPTFGQKPEAPAEPLKLALAPGNAGRIMPSEGGPHGAQVEAAVPPNPRPLIDLAQSEGQVGRLTPVQGGLSVPEGPQSITGAPPSSAGANQLIRPLGEAFQPHQPDLFPPQNVSSAPKVKASAKPDGISKADWDLLTSLGFGG